MHCSVQEMAAEDSKDSRKWDARDWALLFTSAALVGVILFAGYRTYVGFQRYKEEARLEQELYDKQEYFRPSNVPYANRNRAAASKNPTILRR